MLNRERFGNWTGLWTIIPILAVGNSSESPLLLLLDYVLDRCVLHGLELREIALFLIFSIALLKKFFRTEERSQVFSSERRIAVEVGRHVDPDEDMFLVPVSTSQQSY